MFFVHVCSSFRNENSGYDEGFSFRHNRYHSPQTSRSHDVIGRVKPSFTSYSRGVVFFVENGDQLWYEMHTPSGISL